MASRPPASCCGRRPVSASSCSPCSTTTGLVLEALEAGARGFVLKTSPVSEVTAAIKAVGSGCRCSIREPRQVALAESRRRSAVQSADDGLSQLTTTEIKVLQQVSAGMTEQTDRQQAVAGREHGQESAVGHIRQDQTCQIELKRRFSASPTGSGLTASCPSTCRIPPSCDAAAYHSSEKGC